MGYSLHINDAAVIRRPHLRVVPLVKLDKRTRFGRRVGELVADFTDGLGGPAGITAVLTTKIADAAMLKAIAEDARADYLAKHSAGCKVTLAHLIRVERRAAAAVKALDIVEKTKPTGVAAYLGKASPG